MADWTHFLVGALGASGVVLGNVILALVRHLRNGRDGNGVRITLKDLRDDIHDLRGDLQPIITRLAVLETDVAYLKAPRHRS